MRALHALRKRFRYIFTVIGLLFLLAVGQAGAVSSFNGGWTQPLDTMPAISAGFLANNCGYSGYGSYVDGEYHIGNDYPKSAGTAVYSIGAGVVVAIQSGWPGSAVFIKHTAYDGTQFLGVYGHIDSSVVNGATVSAGQQIGTVYDQGSNSHLHFGIRNATTPASSNNGNLPCSSWPDSNGYVNPLPYLDSHPITSAPMRVLNLNSTGALSSKEGSLTTTWTLVDTADVDYSASPNRIAILESDGTLLVKEGYIGAPLVPVDTGVSPGMFKVTDNRVFVNHAGNLSVKVGSLTAGWTLVDTTVTDFQVSPNRVAILEASGKLNVIEGPIGTPATTVISSGVATGSFKVTDTRVGHTDSSGELYVKDGGLGVTWTDVGGGVLAFQLT